MPLSRRGRGKRRPKSLREKILSSKARSLALEEIDDDNRSIDSEESRSSKVIHSSDSFSSTPLSLKGSFLRNKLENPLFKSLFSSSKKHSALKTVQNASDVEDSEEDEGSSSECEVEEEDKRIEREHESRWSFFKPGSRFFFDSSRRKSFLFASKAKSKKSSLRQMQRSRRRRGGSRISSDSNSSRTSNDSSYDTENEVDMLTKLEDCDENVNAANGNDNPIYVLYTHKGQAVRVQFFFDYLLISPAGHKSKAKSTPKIVYYEDLALWTNNDSCLRLVHIKNKNTARQDRCEIKLFVNKKKVVITPRELNEELKDRVSILMAGKMNIDASNARKLLEKNATEHEVEKVVQEIDRNGKMILAQSYSKEQGSTECYELLNV